MKTTITVPKDKTRPVRLALPLGAYSALRSGGSAVLPLLRPNTKGAALLVPGARVEILLAGPHPRRVRRPASLPGCVVGRRDEAYADTFPAGSIPAGHRGPIAALSLVTDAHAEALRALGPLSESLPHYVAPATA